MRHGVNRAAEEVHRRAVRAQVRRRRRLRPRRRSDRGVRRIQQRRTAGGAVPGLLRAVEAGEHGEDYLHALRLL